MDLSKLLPILFSGMLKSLEIFGLTIIISIPLGMLVAFGKMSKHKIISFPIKLYILIMRGTPLMLQLICVYFIPGAISQSLGYELNYDRFLACIIAFSINYAAYFAEIFRGGIESVPKGQYEASEILGLTKVQTFFKIVLPQVIKRVLPASSNEVITLVKDTSLAQVIGVAELFTKAREQMSVSLLPLFVAGVFYFVLNWIVTIIFSFFEKRLNYYKI